MFLRRIVTALRPPGGLPFFNHPRLSWGLCSSSFPSPGRANTDCLQGSAALERLIVNSLRGVALELQLSATSPKNGLKIREGDIPFPVITGHQAS